MKFFQNPHYYYKMSSYNTSLSISENKQSAPIAPTPEGLPLPSDLMSIIDDYIGKPLSSFSPEKEYRNLLNVMTSYKETGFHIYYGPLFTESECIITYSKWGGGKIMIDCWYKKEHNHAWNIIEYILKTTNSLT